MAAGPVRASDAQFTRTCLSCLPHTSIWPGVSCLHLLLSFLLLLLTVLPSYPALGFFSFFFLFFSFSFFLSPFPIIAFYWKNAGSVFQQDHKISQPTSRSFYNVHWHSSPWWAELIPPSPNLGKPVTTEKWMVCGFQSWVTNGHRISASPTRELHSWNPVTML